MKAEPIIIERTCDAPPDRIWAAITEKEQMKVWYFDLAEFKARVGFEFQFLAGKPEKKWLHLCKVTEVVPGKKLTHSWRYDGREGISYVTFELIKEGNQTLVRLTHKGIETFPQDDPDFARENFVQGWTHIIGTALKGYVEGKPV